MKMKLVLFFTLFLSKKTKRIEEVRAQLNRSYQTLVSKLSDQDPTLTS